MKRFLKKRVRQIVFFPVFALLLFVCFRPLLAEKLAAKTGEVCRISVFPPRGNPFSFGRYLRFTMPKRARGEFDASGHGFLLLRQVSGDGSFRMEKVVPRPPTDGTPYLRVVRISRWWEGITVPFDTYLLPRTLTPEEEEKLDSLSSGHKWEVVLKVKNGCGFVENLLIDGLPLCEHLSLFR